MRAAFVASLFLSAIFLVTPVWAEETKPASPEPSSVGATPGTPPKGATPASEKPVAPPAADATHPAEIQPGAEPKGVPAGSAEAEKGDSSASDARVARMRDRWSKMTPEQKEEMRQKAGRRLDERYERLSSQEQTQVNGLLDQINKLNKEQRSILMAKIHQKAYQERAQRRLMKEQENKGVTPASATPGATQPAEKH